MRGTRGGTRRTGLISARYHRHPFRATASTLTQPNDEGEGEGRRGSLPLLREIETPVAHLPSRSTLSLAALPIGQASSEGEALLHESALLSEALAHDGEALAHDGANCSDVAMSDAHDLDEPADVSAEETESSLPGSDAVFVLDESAESASDDESDDDSASDDELADESASDDESACDDESPPPLRKSSKPSKLAKASKPAKVSKPAKISKSMKSSEPAESSEPAKSSKPTKSSESAKSSKPKFTRAPKGSKSVRVRKLKASSVSTDPDEQVSPWSPDHPAYSLFRRLGSRCLCEYCGRTSAAKRAHSSHICIAHEGERYLDDAVPQELKYDKCPPRLFTSEAMNQLKKLESVVQRHALTRPDLLEVENAFARHIRAAHSLPAIMTNNADADDEEDICNDP